MKDCETLRLLFSLCNISRLCLPFFVLSTEEIEAVFKSGGGADQVITQAILKGANESIRNVYQNVADKYQVRGGK